MLTHLFKTEHWILGTMQEHCTVVYTVQLATYIQSYLRPLPLCCLKIAAFISFMNSGSYNIHCMSYTCAVTRAVAKRMCLRVVSSAVPSRLVSSPSRLVSFGVFSSSCVPVQATWKQLSKIRAKANLDLDIWLEPIYYLYRELRLVYREGRIVQLLRLHHCNAFYDALGIVYCVAWVVICYLIFLRLRLHL